MTLEKLLLKLWLKKAKFQVIRRDKEQYVLYQQALDMGVHGTHTRLLGVPPNTHYRIDI